MENSCMISAASRNLWKPAFQGSVNKTPRQIEREGVRNASNNNDDAKTNFCDKRKEKNIQTNEESDSSSSLEDEELRLHYKIHRSFNIPTIWGRHLKENSVPPKHNDCGDVTHDVFMHEIADILAYKLPYSVEHEKGLKGQSV
ncbi:hypothetical protein MTR_1g004960 [Medicago truncatula]|uniref:Uncharacterized protein n=1 Tax=Medicago truncatula TaxID=3880 RepID=A0A072VCD9_MEDTR|nr:hypothetical protein MTR_1g004960 [Medicago truncatula]